MRYVDRASFVAEFPDWLLRAIRWFSLHGVVPEGWRDEIACEYFRRLGWKLR